MSEQKPGLIRRMLRGIWAIINTSRRIVLNLLFVVLFIGFLSAVFSGGDKAEIPPSAALVLNLKGDLVEEKRWVDPVEAAINESSGGGDAPEILVRDLVKTIEHASKDERIKAIVLDLSDMGSGSLDKLKTVGTALETFKKTGKKVLATGSFYSQNQYYLATYADSINLTPMGSVILEGYGSFPMYYKSALEKLKVTTHVFKVGTYKSAVEPFTRDDMSPEAKEANKAWLDELWATYKADIAQRRGFEVSNIDETFASLLQKINAADGDTAQYSLQNKLVDTIKTREEFRKDVIALVGENEKKTFNQVSVADYQTEVIPPMPMVNPMTEKVALVIARGTIVDGSTKAGTIGGDSTAKLLRTARLDDKVKAVVLRIDSGGGSAFASELIAEEIRLLKAAGKPVIASMGAVAASGGYWIAAPANEIYAAPTTITGSIGIFALFHTFENIASTVGVNVDGVGTTELAGFSAGLPMVKGLESQAGALIQRMIDKGYDQFISHVAENRKLTKEAVDKIGQGRVWTGQKALEFGLVDKLGTLDDAIAAAAAKASLTQFDVQVIEHELTEEELLLQKIFGTAQTYGLIPATSQSAESKMLSNIVRQVKQDMGIMSTFNDPNGIYSYCFACDITAK